MPNDVDAVLFDLDDTLSVYRRGQAELLSVSFERAGIEPFFDARDYIAQYDAFYGDGETDVDDLRERCFVAICRDRGRDPELGGELAAHYAAERDQTNVRFREGAQAALEGVAGEVPIGVVTNGDREMQRVKLEGLGIAELVDEVVYGGVAVPAKPEPEPFEVALSALDVRPDRTVHVGNSLSTDVAGARTAGVESVWAPTAGDLPDGVADPAAIERLSEAVEPAPDHVVTDMAAVPTILDVSERRRAAGGE